MDLFDHTTAVIRRGGRRRGANMAVLRIDHPDIEEFIDAKRTPGRLENFNLSVGVTEEFLAALDNKERFSLRNPRTGRVMRRVDPACLLEAIVGAAWETGDPGFLFLDEINRDNPTPALGSIEATNPCGEQPLLPHESCTLGSINLVAFAGDHDLEWERLEQTIGDAVVFLDNVIEANRFPFPEIELATRRTRKIGLGVMGLAELLAKIGLPYDSDAGVRMGSCIARFLTTKARAASAELGARRGSFPAFEQSVWPGRGLSALRNATTTCVAPTGTISLIAGTSSGIEPLFALSIERRILDGRVLREINPLVEETLAPLGDLGRASLGEIRERGAMRGIAALPDSIRERFPTALEIPPEIHLQMQAAFQSHMDAGVSKTVNLASDAPLEAVRKVFFLARKLHLKGVTVYRYGSRSGQTLSLLGDQARHDCRECAE
jgi:ribonucleoside-diphosphate reductase alpha chain